MTVGMVVSRNFFDVLGVAPQFGRSFRPDEDRVAGRDAVVVLSHGLWEQLGSDPAILGRNVKIAGINFSVIGVAPDSFTALAMFSAILFGLIPAIQTTRTDLTNALKAAMAPIAGGRRVWGRNLLGAMQVAVSLVLLTIAAFMYRMFASELRGGMGFRANHVLLMSFDPSLARHNGIESQRFFERLGREAREAAGVKSATVASAAPMLFPDVTWIAPEGHPFAAGQESASVYSCTVD
jgi:hypothetical protein